MLRLLLMLLILVLVNKWTGGAMSAWASGGQDFLYAMGLSAMLTPWVVRQLEL
jgi:hypothetical protein